VVAAPVTAVAEPSGLSAMDGNRPFSLQAEVASLYVPPVFAKTRNLFPPLLLEVALTANQSVPALLGM
jgi:hypothetical protein